VSAKSNERLVPSGIPSGLARIFIREERGAGIQTAGRHINKFSAYLKEPGYHKEEIIC
jgi:hypothetical protein